MLVIFIYAIIIAECFLVVNICYSMFLSDKSNSFYCMVQSEWIFKFSKTALYTSQDKTDFKCNSFNYFKRTLKWSQK